MNEKRAFNKLYIAIKEKANAEGSTIKAFCEKNNVSRDLVFRLKRGGEKSVSEEKFRMLCELLDIKIAAIERMYLFED